MFDKVKTRIRVARDIRILKKAGPPRNDRGQFVKRAGPVLAKGVRLGRERIKLSTTAPEERARLDEVKLATIIYRRNKLAMANALVRSGHPLFDGVKTGPTPARRRQIRRRRQKAAVAARSAYVQSKAS